MPLTHRVVHDLLECLGALMVLATLIVGWCRAWRFASGAYEWMVKGRRELIWRKEEADQWKKKAQECMELNHRQAIQFTEDVNRLRSEIAELRKATGYRDATPDRDPIIVPVACDYSQRGRERDDAEWWR